MSKRENTTCKQTCENNIQPDYIKRNAKLQKKGFSFAYFFYGSLWCKG